MAIRRRARETALQFLFQEEMAQAVEPLDDLLTRFEPFCRLYEVPKKSRAYALEILQGVAEHGERIDTLLSASGSSWRLSRLSGVERNLLRVAVYEMAVRDDVPPQVAINEAIEIARRYGGDEAPAFVNGVLDAVRRDLPQVEER